MQEFLHHNERWQESSFPMTILSLLGIPTSSPIHMIPTASNQLEGKEQTPISSSRIIEFFVALLSNTKTWDDGPSPKRVTNKTSKT